MLLLADLPSWKMEDRYTERVYMTIFKDCRLIKMCEGNYLNKWFPKADHSIWFWFKIVNKYYEFYEFFYHHQDRFPYHRFSILIYIKILNHILDSAISDHL